MGIIQFVLIMAFALASVGLPFGHIEKVMWAEPLYWGIILPLFFFTIANLIYYFFVDAMTRKPDQSHMGWAIGSCIVWVLAFLACTYSLIIFIIVLAGCQGNAQCDKTMICDESGTIPGSVYSGARPRFIVIMAINGLCAIASVILIAISCLGMRKSTDAVGARRKSEKPY